MAVLIVGHCLPSPRLQVEWFLKRRIPALGIVGHAVYIHCIRGLSQIPRLSRGRPELSRQGLPEMALDNCI